MKILQKSIALIPLFEKENNVVHLQQQREDDIETFLEQWEKDSPAIFLYSPNYVYVSPEHFSISKGITNSSDRFNTIDQWYQETRHVWNFLIRDNG